jgi:hypothetical protein
MRKKAVNKNQNRKSGKTSNSLQRKIETAMREDINDETYKAQRHDSSVGGNKNPLIANEKPEKNRNRSEVPVGEKGFACHRKKDFSIKPLPPTAPVPPN